MTVNEGMDNGLVIYIDSMILETIRKWIESLGAEGEISAFAEKMSENTPKLSKGDYSEELSFLNNEICLLASSVELLFLNSASGLAKIRDLFAEADRNAATQFGM